ncbi:MAG: complex I NDUFA9 subunit family protein [Geminicoccaceae bacterium]|nr:MAG: complex I NDUFA9 subunit family protein [Geminicoccaceae bacterium]
MRNEVVTVFGGSGFLGRYVVRRLAAEGARVRVICRRPQLAMHLKPMGEVGQITLERADLAGGATIAPLVEGSTYVVNLIGILFEWGGQKFDVVQAEVPGRIAEAAKAAGVKRLVQVSAIGADASSAANYARTKALGEQSVLAAFPEATILRPSVVFGPEDDFFNRFGQMTGISPFLPLIDGGQTRFQPVYVDDVAKAVMVALSEDGHAGKTYELGGPDVYTFKELLSYLLKQLNKKRLLLPLPSKIARIQARFMEYLPKPPLTRDQLELLKHDNVVAIGALTFKELGIEPTPMEVIVPTYVKRYARTLSKRG